MSLIAKQYLLLKDRVKLGTLLVPTSDYPFTAFIVGYYLGKGITQQQELFDYAELIYLLHSQKLITIFMTQQLLTLLEDHPSQIRSINNVLNQLRDGKYIDFVRWIESYYEGNKINSNRINIEMDKNEQQIDQALMGVDGTLQLSNSHTEQLQVEQQRRRQQQMDIQFAKKMQEQLNNELPNNVQADDAPCQICYGGLYDQEFQPIDRCGHPFHKNCLIETFKINILNNNFPIRCPKDGCGVQVSEGDLKIILKEDLFQKYQQHTLKAYADLHGDSVSWCPTASCGYMFFYQKDDNERFQCLQCHKEYCLNCRVEWHRDMTCKEYKITSTTSEDDKKFIEFVKGKKFKQCPKCKFWVQKNQGCDHMTCRCKYQFCYKCGGVYMKCECVQKMKQEMEARRLRAQEARRRKQERKRKAAQPKKQSARTRKRK